MVGARCAWAACRLDLLGHFGAHHARGRALAVERRGGGQEVTHERVMRGALCAAGLQVLQQLAALRAAGMVLLHAIYGLQAAFLKKHALRLPVTQPGHGARTRAAVKAERVIAVRGAVRLHVDDLLHPASKQARSEPSNLRILAGNTRRKLQP